jgi:hypothetical protein
MIAFMAVQAIEPLFENRVLAVPQREREAQVLMAIAETCEAVFIPTVGARSGVVVRKGFPGAAEWTIVLSHRSPGPFAHIGAPSLPMLFPSGIFFNTLGFGSERRACRGSA